MTGGHRPIWILLLAVAALAAGTSQRANGQEQKWQSRVTLEQKLNAPLPLDATFRDHDGQTVRLGDYFDDQPVILMPVYYRCPMLCGLVLKGMVRCLRAMELTPGEDFQIVTFSIDPREKPTLAAEKRKNYLAQYGREEAHSGWHFLTGTQPQIGRLCEAIGFQAEFNEESGQYAHAAGIVVCTPDGRAARYFYGVEFAPRDLRLGLVEASENKIGSVTDQVLLYCYLYDPTRGKYGLAILNGIRAAGVLTVVVLAGGILRMLRREQNRPSEEIRHGTADG